MTCANGCDRAPYGRGLCRACYTAERESRAPACPTAGCDGRAIVKGVCRRCYRRAQVAAHVAAHPELKRARDARYQAAHPGRLNELKRAARAARGPSLAVRLANAQRRAQKRAAGGTVTRAEWEAVVVEFHGLCAYCLQRRPLVMEHMTPLSRGGSHDLANVVPACAPCNGRKYTRDLVQSLEVL